MAKHAILFYLLNFYFLRYWYVHLYIIIKLTIASKELKIYKNLYTYHMYLHAKFNANWTISVGDVTKKL